ncbi:MAG TPA: cbb3-type cytochrome c oxidase subunit I [Terriglobales bacterium]|nr:cbb3-type cytochrome c oxidase subunit I [Terriglobales bacterium]
MRNFRFIDERPGSTARRFIISGAWWFLLATAVGLTAATELVAPESVHSKFLLFPRIRPIHVNTNVFGFLSMLLVGAMLFAVCRLCRAPLWSERLGNWTMWIWNLAIVAGILTLAMGYTKSHEYAEYVWPVDVLILAGLLMLAWNVFQTLRRRREELLYVSNWYFAGALVATSVVFVIGNVMWKPATGALHGMTDAEWAWFYGHNIFGTWVTALGLGLSYFWIPREADQPLYSHTLSLIGFWPYFAFYLQVGTHHLIEAPAPDWLKLIAEINSIALLIPVFAFLTNQWMTLRGKWWRIPDSVVLKFIFAGTVFYFFTSTEGTLLSLPSVERITHFTDWIVGHSHIGLLGFTGFIACGAGYGALREMYGTIWSERLANLQYWLMLIGVVGFTLVLDDAGSIQGNAWRNGEVVYRVLPELMNDYIVRAMLGCFIVTAAGIQLYNYWRTTRMQPACTDQPPAPEPGGVELEGRPWA